MGKKNLAVIRHDSTERTVCALCGAHDIPPDKPFWIFVDADPGKPICFGCAQMHELQLTSALTELNIKEREASGDFIETENRKHLEEQRTIIRNQNLDLDRKLDFNADGEAKSAEGPGPVIDLGVMRPY